MASPSDGALKATAFAERSLASVAPEERSGFSDVSPSLDTWIKFGCSFHCRAKPPKLQTPNRNGDVCSVCQLNRLSRKKQARYVSLLVEVQRILVCLLRFINYLFIHI